MTTTIQEPGSPRGALHHRLRRTWSAGDYGAIGTTLQIVGELLCEAADVRGRARVLDVATGTGNAALAAARRAADVDAVDFVPALVAHARERAAADRLSLRVHEADAHALPFADGTFDVVLSVFGVMFAADHARAARELLRVCRRGGRLALACWTPDGFVGQMLAAVGRHVPPPPGAQPPTSWGTEHGIRQLIGGDVEWMMTRRRDFVFRYRSPVHFLDVFARCYGPLRVAIASLRPSARYALVAELDSLLAGWNRADDGTVVVPGAYLEVVAERA